MNAAQRRKVRRQPNKAAFKAKLAEAKAKANGQKANEKAGSAR